TLDEPQLVEQSGELVRRVLPFDAVCLPQDESALRAATTAEVPQQPSAHPLRFADVEDAAVLGEHAIDPGARRGVVLYRVLQRGELLLGGGPPARGQLLHASHGADYQSTRSSDPRNMGGTPA